MKQSDVADRTVQVWLSGPFSSVGTSFTNVGSTWKKYSFSLVLPLWAAGTDNRDIRLNIRHPERQRLARPGQLQPSRRRCQSPRQVFPDAGGRDRAPIHPAGFLCRSAAGRFGRTAGRYLPGNETPSLSALGRTVASCGSLYTALRLVESSGADPWLVIDSFASEAELLDLIEYLAGSYIRADGQEAAGARPGHPLD